MYEESGEIHFERNSLTGNCTMKKIVSFCAAALLVCGASSAAERISFATGGTSGTYYPIGSAIASVISKNLSGVEVTAEATGASVANMKMMRAGDVDMIMGASNSTFGGYAGEPPFEGQAVTTIRGVMSLYPEIFQFVVLKGAGIAKIEDLKGKKVAVGAPGSGTERTAGMILAAHGLTYKDINPQFLNFSEAITALKDRIVDCAVVGAGVPTSAVMDASTLLDVDLLPLSEDKVPALLKDRPYLAVYPIPAGTYRSVTKEVKAAGSPALWSVRDTLPEDLVYNMLKTVFEHLSVVAESHAQAKTMSLESSLSAMSVPLHPGAARFYKEKGIDVTPYLKK
jgi:TRAP transporter TAXI family solute receptor